MSAMKALKILSIVFGIIGFILFAIGVPVGMFFGEFNIGLSITISMGGFLLVSAAMVMGAVYQSRNRKAGRGSGGTLQGGIGYPDLPPIPTALSARKCPRCGEEVEVSDRYCPRCGYRLDGSQDEDEVLQDRK